MSKKTNVIELNGYIVSKRPSILKSDELKLWVRSGGRCAICNKYLLDLDYDVSIGEMAHIVGWSKTKGSPRGDAQLDISVRNKVDNLILLCAVHHKIVDTKALLEEFSLERLIQDKSDHERRIHHLTALKIDSESFVLRMLGGIRNASVEVSNEHARNVIFESERKFARFIDSFDRHGIEINLNNLSEPEEDWDAYWSMGKGIIDRGLRCLIEGIDQGKVRHLSVFAMSRIPLLVYLGFELDDKIPTSLYQKHRGEKESWMWSDKEQVETFEVIKLNESTHCNVALILSLSGSIDVKMLPAEIVKSCNLYEIKPVGTIPNRNILKSKASFENFNRTYHAFLSQLEIEQKGCSEIHLFPAIPVTAAISCGRGLMRDSHPSLTIYDLSKGAYKPTLTVNQR